MVRAVLFFLLVSGSSFGNAQSINWKEVFPVRNHDFGTVAVAAKTEFRFPIQNQSGRSIHIRKIRTSCGCTTPIIESKTIAPNETSYIRARFNTDTFRGKRGANLTVVIDRPVYTEVRLRVDGYIRSDMVFHPGAVEFAEISSEQESMQAVKVLYAGRKNWQILNVESPQPWMTPTFTEVSRGRGRITYEVAVTLAADAPTGFFQDELVVLTNDSEMPRIPLRVSGEVSTPLKISPGAIALGKLKPGESSAKKLIVIGQTPFIIDSITADGWTIEVALGSEPKKTHILVPAFIPVGDTPGHRKSTLVIRTSGNRSMNTTALVTADIRGE